VAKNAVNRSNQRSISAVKFKELTEWAKRDIKYKYIDYGNGASVSDHLKT